MKPARIILVEQNTDDAKRFLRFCRKQHICNDILQYSTAEQALRVFSQGILCDLLVVDMQLPDGDGLELIRKIRQIPDYETLPVVILSHEQQDEALLASWKLDVAVYIVKPLVAEKWWLMLSELDRIHVAVMVEEEQVACSY